MRYRNSERHEPLTVRVNKDKYEEVRKKEFKYLGSAVLVGQE